MSVAPTTTIAEGSYHLVRVLILRYIAFIFFVAFLVSLNQNPYLIGDHGLEPANHFLNRVHAHYGGKSSVRADPRVAMDKIMTAAHNKEYGRLGEHVTTWFSPIVEFKAVAVNDALSFIERILVQSYSFVGGDGGRAGVKLPQFTKLFKQVPTILWLVPKDRIDDAITLMSSLGCGIAAFVVLFGRCSGVMMIAMWAMYMSIVSVGQTWYGFGWEAQLLESSFVAIFLCPSFLSMPVRTKFSQTDNGAPFLVRWAYRWLIFRIMLGAGLIKLRGDQCWRDLTCMNYHYQTQPVPNPLSALYHFSPDWFHAFEVMTNHFVECSAPFFVFLPGPAAAIGGLIQIGFQLILISSGNLSFLNWLTILPALGCFEDRQVQWMFSKMSVQQVAAINQAQFETYYGSRSQQQDKAKLSLMAKLRSILKRPVSWHLRRIIHIAVILLLGYLSVPVVRNLVSPGQVMNTSYDWLKIVGTYGAFGSVTKVRNEVIVQGYSKKTKSWVDYEFNCKPGDVHRRPCIISPYHYRLDWLMWFAAFQDYQHNPWLVHLAYRMLNVHDDKTGHSAALVKNLIAYDPFQEDADKFGEAPLKIRMRLIRYTYNKKAATFTQLRTALSNEVSTAIATAQHEFLSSTDGHKNETFVVALQPTAPYWKRGSAKEYLPEVTKRDLDSFMRRMFG